MLILLMGGIYEASCRDCLRCHDTRVHTRFHEDWFRHSNDDDDDDGGMHIQTHAKVNLKGYFHFFTIKESD